MQTPKYTYETENEAPGAENNSLTQYNQQSVQDRNQNRESHDEVDIAELEKQILTLVRENAFKIATKNKEYDAFVEEEEKVRQELQQLKDTKSHDVYIAELKKRLQEQENRKSVLEFSKHEQYSL